ncbi:F-box/FBD/LRR-repeat protein At1g13570-like [Vicia villosa]|uniref:F-box/FBD/LRR-repeat protein At1g13570-like n=1 Tax=Vicia villosa TaxID=3911 RepID=UPI00273BA831|nr:F-box/FBD/LRR-repeat protein At1g13570-like [Vicia villosa]
MFSHRDPNIRESTLHDTFATFGPVLSCKVSIDDIDQSGDTILFNWTIMGYDVVLMLNFMSLSSDSCVLYQYIYLKAAKPSKTARPTVIDAELEDRISWLPGHIIDQILSHLPIRHAVTTSALSKMWRYKWTTIPNLVFDRECVYEPSRCPSDIVAIKLLRIIHHVLSRHSGPINKFVFFYQEPVIETYFDRWILWLTRKSIKELELEIWNCQPYKLPCCLYSCQSLHRIQLYHCWIHPPSAFKGFRNLKILKLDDVTITQVAFENLISGCPLLEDLRLTWLDGFTQAIIHAPNLKNFEIYDVKGGILESIIFENTFQLTKVTIDLNMYMNFEINQSRSHGCSSKLLNLFSHLPHLQSLEICSCFLKYLAAGVVPVMLPTSCISLSYLSLCIRFNNLKEISAVLCLLKSSPNLQKLELYEPKEEEEDGTALLAQVSYCWKDIFFEPTIPLGARHVRIVDISGTKSEIDLIKFLLLYSPLLEKMYVKPSKNVKPELVTEISGFRRASGQVEVIYDGETTVQRHPIGCISPNEETK